MRVGGDPDELERAAAGWRWQKFTLDIRARALELDGAAYRARSHLPGADVTEAVRALRQLGTGIVELDRWVERVAVMLRAADRSPVRSRLLSFGPRHPLTAASSHGDAGRVRWSAVPDADLEQLSRWRELPLDWRDRAHRERMRRWLGRLDERVAAVPPDELGNGPLDRFVRRVDEHLVDRASAVTDLHVTHDEEVALLRAQADGVRRLLGDRRLTVLSFSSYCTARGVRATARVAFGDVATAERLVVLLPGTTSGVHHPGPALGDADALHDRMTVSPPAGGVATVLDLYDAPLDLGRAADPATGEAAGRATARFLAELPDAGVPFSKVTLVGHSYGAFTAARAMAASGTERPPDALVLLGAPGTGALHRDELGHPDAEVWAALAPGDPIRAVADADELLAALPERWRPGGALAEPGVALGPDPTDPEFGARRLPTGPIVDPDAGPVVTRPPITGHLDYLRRHTASLSHVARVALGRPLPGAGHRHRPGTAGRDGDRRDGQAR